MSDIKYKIETTLNGASTGKVDANSITELLDDITIGVLSFDNLGNNLWVESKRTEDGQTGLVLTPDDIRAFAKELEAKAEQLEEH